MRNYDVFSALWGNTLLSSGTSKWRVYQKYHCTALRTFNPKTHKKLLKLSICKMCSLVSTTKMWLFSFSWSMIIFILKICFLVWVYYVFVVLLLNVDFINCWSCFDVIMNSDNEDDRGITASSSIFIEIYLN